MTKQEKHSEFYLNKFVFTVDGESTSGTKHCGVIFNDAPNLQ